MILVIAEQKDGVLNRASWEAVAAAQKMGGPVKVVVPGASAGAAVKELASADVAEVVSLEHASLGQYTADGFVQDFRVVLDIFCNDRALSPDDLSDIHNFSHQIRTSLRPSFRLTG